VSTFNLFVYGTLLSGSGADALLGDCERLGAGTVHGTLYDIDGRFPAIVLYGAASVRGEVWRCPAPLLLQLDRYEGVEEGLFRRVAVEPALADGAAVPAWIYAAGPALSRKLRQDARVPGGDWRAHRAATASDITRSTQ
jgi:gamma-glutamylaminecyclotransferase